MDQGGTINRLIIGRENKVLAALLILCGVFITIIVVTTVASAMRDSNGKSYMSLNIVPSTARVKIGSDEYRNGVWEMPKGKYEAEIYAEGFNTKNIMIEVNGGTTTVFDYLVNTENGLDYAEEDANDIKIMRHIKDNAAVSEFLIKHDKKLEIKDMLPIQSYYGCEDHENCSSDKRIDIEEMGSGDGCHRELCLLVIGRNGGSEEEVAAEAKHSLGVRGYNIADYEVVYEYR